MLSFKCGGLPNSLELGCTVGRDFNCLKITRSLCLAPVHPSAECARLAVGDQAPHADWWSRDLHTADGCPV